MTQRKSATKRTQAGRSYNVGGDSLHAIPT